MKKILFFIITLSFLVGLPVSASAAEPDLTKYSIANGVVQSSDYDDLTAPSSGTLLPFDWEAGDTVTTGDTLFEIMTQNLYAPEDGTVGYLFVEAGDSADAVTATYGAVLALQPAARQRMHCSYSGAADYEENRHLHIGDKLFFKAGNEKGTGTVISTVGDNYEVEITSGSFDSGKTLTLFKDSAYGNDDKVGSGKVYYRDDIPVPASGRIVEIMVQPGETVRKGDLLLRLMAQDADAEAKPSVSAPVSGVIGTVMVSPGQQVWKGQLLCRVWHGDQPEVVAQVDEMDLGGLHVGDKVPVTMDTDEDTVLTGTVTEISSLGVMRQNAAYYTVHIRLPGTGLMLGQSASVYLPRAGS